MDRDAFLTRVGRAVMAAELPGYSRDTSELTDLEAPDLVARFRERALSVSAVVHGPMSRHGAPRAIAGIASGHGATSYMAWDDMPVTGVPAALDAAGHDRIYDPGEHGPTYEIGVGVTGADAGLAESGSLVLSHGPGRPRMASLAPNVHIAVLDVRVIADGLAHWAQRNASAPLDTANLVLITGPSRTGDIEMHLNLGVHGPRHLHVVLVT